MLLKILTQPKQQQKKPNKNPERSIKAINVFSIRVILCPRLAVKGGGIGDRRRG